MVLSALEPYAFCVTFVLHTLLGIYIYIYIYIRGGLTPWHAWQMTGGLDRRGSRVCTGNAHKRTMIVAVFS